MTAMLGSTDARQTGEVNLMGPRRPRSQPKFMSRLDTTKQLFHAYVVGERRGGGTTANHGRRRLPRTVTGAVSAARPADHRQHILVLSPTTGQTSSPPATTLGTSTGRKHMTTPTSWGWWSLAETSKERKS